MTEPHPFSGMATTTAATSTATSTAAAGAAAGSAPKLRVALTGAGDISRQPPGARREVGAAEVVAICARDRSRADSRARQFGIPATYSDAASMLERERPDAVDVATTRETHVPLTLLAAEHGAHVLCQKPLAPTL